MHGHNEIFVAIPVLFQCPCNFGPSSFGEEGVAVKWQNPASTNGMTSMQNSMVPSAVVVHNILVLIMIRGVQDPQPRGMPVFQKFSRAKVIRPREILQPKVSPHVFFVSERHAHVLLTVSREEVDDFTFDLGVHDAVQEPPLFRVDKVWLVVKNKLKVGVGLSDSMSGG